MRQTSPAVRRAIQSQDIESVICMDISNDFTESPPYTTVTHRLCQYQHDLTVFGQTYRAIGCKLRSVRRQLQDSRDEMEIVLDNSSLEHTAYLASNRLTGARCSVFKVLLGYVTSFMDRIPVIDGFFSSPGLTNTTMVLKVLSNFQVYGETPFPRRLFRSNCNYILGEPACGIDLDHADNNLTFTVLADSTRRFVFYDAGFEAATPGTGDASSYWLSGRIEGLTGVNKGHARLVESVDTGLGTIVLRSELPFVPGTNDTFRIRRGCNKTKPECETGFSNLANFGGYAEIPQKQLQRFGN